MDRSVVNKAKLLSIISIIFFVTAFVVSKIQYLLQFLQYFQIPLISPICNIISNVLSLAGNILWYVQSKYLPEAVSHSHAWYGFAQFKEQHRLAALLGLVAAAIGIAAIITPILLIPASWILLGSNIIWSIGEYHKLNNTALHDESYSHAKQKSFLSYTLTMSSLGLLGAVATTIIVLFPPAFFPILIITGIIGISLSSLAVSYMLEYIYGPEIPVEVEESYAKMGDLQNSSNLEPEITNNNPYHSTKLFQDIELSQPPTILSDTCLDLKVS